VAICNDGIGMHFPAVIAGGGTYADIPDNMQPAWDWFTKLKANSPLLGEDPDFTAWFQNGEIDVACTISSNAREARNNGIKVDWTVPTEGAKMDTDCLWIPKGLPEGDLYWTKQYINYAISPETAGVADAAPPARRRARLKAGGPLDDMSYPTTDEQFARLIFVPPKVQVEHQSEWFAKVKEIMQS
jgi:putative spermidine/putrescine transport system substrate-binding protein